MAHVMTLTLLALGLVLAPAAGARAQTPPSQSAPPEVGPTPARLSYVDGEASFWRPGASDWAPAQLNTPLAPGDELYTGARGSLELQVGTRAFVRTSNNTQLGLVNQEPDFQQFKVTRGHVSLDLRSVDVGRGVEVDTPHATFTIEQPGYYRVDVTPERTSFITRRGGRAAMTPAGGQAVAMTAGEAVVLEAGSTRTVYSYAAPALDPWDRWNHARTDQILEAASARYVSPDVYGAAELDHYGYWRVVPTYGSVWIPGSVPAGWVPYSTGRWIRDPVYGWTWVDVAPWGWAPYHYGRWVFVDPFWAWAPGPMVRRSAYAPALVAFFGAPGIGLAVSGPAVSWVALSWGEPLVPWWGRAGFIGRPWWGGWAGPRVVNNVVINRTTVVNVRNITVYQNANVRRAVVTARGEPFGRRPVQDVRLTEGDGHRWGPAGGRGQVRPEPAGGGAASGRAVQQPAAPLPQPVFATRPPSPRPLTPRAEAQPATPPVNAPAPRVVSAPNAAAAAPAPSQPPFGPSPLERQRRPVTPRFEPTQRAEQPGRAVEPPRGRAVELSGGRRVELARGRAVDSARGPAVDSARGPAVDSARGPAVDSTRGPAVDAARRRAVESAQASTRPLPGDPANRPSLRRAEREQRRSESEGRGERSGRDGR